MNLPNDKINLTRELIAKLYSSPFDEALVLEIGRSVTQLVDAHYSGLLIYAQTPLPVLITNNPPEFTPIYLSVINEDFLLDSLVATHSEIVLHRIRKRVEYEKDKQNFIETVQNARPISDIVYLPIILDGMIIGQWSFGRAGLKSPIFSENQVELIRFIGSFLIDAFTRSLIPPPPEEETAYLDHAGHVVSMGAKIEDAFTALFGRGLILASRPSHGDRRKLFKTAYQRFLQGPLHVGMDRLTLHFQDKHYAFQFSILRSKGIPLRAEGLPYASVRLLDNSMGMDCAQVIDWPAISRMYGFTPRESDVVLEILEGRMNKEIADTLGVEESTIKRHTHNIYEKTGFRSRTELVLGITRGANLN
jgi:DNA-binding CsgD family transcriptional regulator